MAERLIQIQNLIEKIIKLLLGALVLLITFIIFIQVLFRYIFQQSLKGIEELPVFFMIICVYMASALLSRGDNHIKIEMLPLFIKNKKIIKFIESIMQIITSVSLGFFTYLSFDYVKFTYDSNTVSGGLGLPMWMISIFLLISGFIMTINYFINFICNVKELRQWQ